MIRLALDAMGGDNAPACVVRGADIACCVNPHLEIVFYGDEARISPLIAKARIQPKFTRKTDGSASNAGVRKCVLGLAPVCDRLVQD